MADTRDSNQPSQPPRDQAGGKFADDPEQQSPPTPAPTEQATKFLAAEEVEPHSDKGHYNVISGVKVAHAKVPKFLKLVYATLTVWAVYYAFTADVVNDRTEASESAEPTVEAGSDAFAVSCAGCHNVTAERKIGPGLLGAAQRLGEQELTNVLKNGRPDKGMPAPSSLGMNEKQIASLKLYIESLK